MAYAAASLDDAVTLFVASHLTLCPVCRTLVDGYDAVGAALMTGVDDVDMSAGSLDALLARLDEPAPPRPPPIPSDGILPRPLLQAVGQGAADLPFRRVAPGIRRYDLPLGTKERPVAIVGLRPGLRVPDHRHSATERGLVLTGGFTDESGHYVRGDVSFRDADEDHDHQQQIDTGVECLVLMVDDGPKIPVTITGKVVNALFGL
jgi:putative transcriptional regulator